MERMVVLFGLLLGAAANAAVPAGVPQVTLGSTSSAAPITIPESSLSGTTGWFTIIAEGTPGAGNYEPFYKDGVAYQVSGGVKAVCISMSYTTSATTDGFQLMSATASFARGASSVTGGVYENGVSGEYYHYAAVAHQLVNTNFMYRFGASTYPGIQASSGAVKVLAILTCKEM